MAIPIAAMVVTMLDPPALISGNALPVNGMRPTMTAMFIIASNTIQANKPKDSKEPN